MFRWLVARGAQYLQYHILNDSLPIAERLVSQSPMRGIFKKCLSSTSNDGCLFPQLLLAAEYPPAHQLGMDMLFRLNAFPQLLAVLLKNKEVRTVTENSILWSLILRVGRCRC